MTTNATTQTIATPCKSYSKQMAYLTLPRTLMGGTPAMRKAEKTFLPQEPNESSTAYNNRLARTILYNGFGKAVRSLTGKILEKGVKLDDDTPEQISELCEYIDTSGRDLERFIHDVVEDAMVVGRSHVLVDFPPKPVDGVLTLEQERELGLRPYWVHVTADNLIYWRLSKGQLVEIRIKEVSEDEKPQIRVITTTEWQLWQQSGQVVNGQSQWAMVDGGPNTLGVVPLATFYTRREGEMVSRPPLEDLAYKNLEHWQSSSDQRHILHIARVPILFGQGFDEDGDVTIGPNQLVKGPRDSDLKYVEHSGAAINAGKEDLMRIEDQMAILAMEPVLNSRTGNQTATGRAIDSAEAQSSIKLIAGDIEDATDLCLGFTAMWLGLPKDQAGGVEIECDFSLLTQDASGLIELGKARALGDISRDAYLNEFKRRGILSAEYDIDSDKELTDEEGMEMMKRQMELQGNIDQTVDQGV